MSELISYQLLVLWPFVECVICRGVFLKQFPPKFPPVDLRQGDPGEPLFLTPYIEKGDVETGTNGSHCCFVFSAFMLEMNTLLGHIFQWLKVQ